MLMSFFRNIRIEYCNKTINKKTDALAKNTHISFYMNGIQINMFNINELHHIDE